MVAVDLRATVFNEVFSIARVIMAGAVSVVMTPCPRVLAILLFAISTFSASAKDLSDGKSGCRISIPDDWVLSNLPKGIGYIARATNPKGNESIGLFVNPSHSISVGALDSSAVKSFLKAYQIPGLTIASQQKRTVNGVSFNVITGVQKSGSTSVNFAWWLTIGNGQMFEIVLDAINSDPDKSTDLTAAINSISIVAK